MSRLEIKELSHETKRWRRPRDIDSVGPGKPSTLYNHGLDGSKEVILFQLEDDIATVSSQRLDRNSSVEPGRMYMIIPLEPPAPLEEIARLGKGESFEIEIKKGPFSIPTQYRVTHK